MKITIDNYDGLGAVDYTAALSGESPVAIQRKLNAPSTCALSLVPGSLGAPGAGARVRASADNGLVLFTGYALAAPARTYAGMETTGPAYTLQLHCVSDEVVLDARVSERTIESVATPIGNVLQTVTDRAGGTAWSIAGDALSTTVGGFQPLAGKSWSANAGALASAVRALYRVVDSEAVFSHVGDETHMLTESDGSLDRGALQAERVRVPMNDVTVCGKTEPTTYITEIFQGDGITSVFQLSEPPLMESASLLSDTFSGATVNPRLWTVSDGGGHVSLTARGLTIGGGQGATGGCSVIAVDKVEMGGVLTLEVTGVQLDAPGEGYLAALFDGPLEATSLFAGFHLRPNGTAMVAVPMVLGVESGASATLQIGHTYTLRLRFHCKDRQRALQTYIAGGANGAVYLGGQTLDATADLVLDIQETTGGALLPPLVLYDGSVLQTPVSCTPAVLNSLSFEGSIASSDLKRPGEVWVRCAVSGSAAATQRLGTTAQSAQAKVSSTGRLSFYPGSVPASGSVVTVNYRLGGHAVARMGVPQNAAVGGLTAGSMIVTAEHPKTRSSADCENAALALLSLSTWTDGAWKGSYTCWNPHQVADVWPGDLLHVDAPSAAMQADLLVRGVAIHATACLPELIHYTIEFANEWAEPLSLTMREGAPLNAYLPPTALAAPTALTSLHDLSVSAISTTQIQIQAGTNAPSDGGFEVRRSDWKFGAGDGADLVLRSPVPNFTIVREAAVERYYVRMYDGATPPNYSRFSSAIFVNAAMQ